MTELNTRKLDVQQQAIEPLFLGIAPEKKNELKEFWSKYGPQFRIVDDDGPAGTLVMDAGLSVLIRFNHRIMRLFWLAGFTLWEGYCACHSYLSTGESNLSRFDELLTCFEATRAAKNVDTVQWPHGIPAPGELVDRSVDDHARIAGELATFAVGWALLHELHHLILQQQERSAPLGDAAACREEEFACDAFATRFLLEHISNYGHDSGQPPSLVAMKRQTGVHCALFAMTLLAKDHWEESDTHPALQDRIERVLKVIEQYGLSKGAAAIAISAFATLSLRHPEAPTPMQIVNEIAIRENWTPLDDLF